MKHTAYSKAVRDLEKALFVKALEDNQYNQSRAAKELGISRGSFRYKIVRYFGDLYATSRR